MPNKREPEGKRPRWDIPDAPKPIRSPFPLTLLINPPSAMRSKNPSVETRSSLNFLRRLSLIIPLVGAFLVTLAGCSDNPVGGGDGPEHDRAPPATFQIEGTVDRQTVDGKEAWVIESVDGQTYLPVNFRPERLEEGLQVRVEAKPLKPQLVEDRREEIDRRLPREEVIAANSGNLIKIKNIESLDRKPWPEAKTNQFYHDLSLRQDAKGI